MKRLRVVLLGRNFTLITDLNSLHYMFSPSNQVPKVVTARLARWAITLMTYDYDVQYTPGHADAMSRLRFTDEIDSTAVAMDTFEEPVIDDKNIRKRMQWNELVDEHDPNWLLEKLYKKGETSRIVQMP